MIEFIITFGVMYAQDPHPAGDWAHPDGYVTIVAPDEPTARDLAIAVIGRDERGAPAFAAIYDPRYDRMPDLSRKTRGEVLRITVEGGK